MSHVLIVENTETNTPNLVTEGVRKAKKKEKKKAKRKALRKQVALENNDEDEELQAKIGNNDVHKIYII